MEIELVKGKLYNCLIELEGPNKRMITENHSIIPLEKDPNSGKICILTNARELINKNKQFVLEIINMPFAKLISDDIVNDYSAEYSSSIIICNLSEGGVLEDDTGALLFSFKETIFL